MGRIKDIPLYNLQDPVKSSDYWIGSDGDTGVTKNYSAASVAGFVAGYIGLDNSVTGLISVGSVSVNDGQVSLQDVVWRIDGEEFTVNTSTLSVTEASENYYRTDIIVGNKLGALALIPGVENQINSAQPALPLDTVLVTVINVFGDSITGEIPSVTDFMLKSDEAQQPFFDAGVVDSIGWSSKNVYRYTPKTGDTLSLGGMSIEETSDFMYDGRVLKIINAGANDGQTLTLRHLDTSGIPFYFYNETDLLVKVGRIATFVYTSAENRLELISITRIEEGEFGEVTAADVSYDGQYATVQEALDALLYVNPDILTFTNNIGTVEKGTVITSVILSWTLNKTMTTGTLNNGIGSVNPNALTYTHNGQSITANRTYSLAVGDGQNTDSLTTSVQFLNRRFWGTSPNTSLTNSQVLALQNSELSASRLQTRTINGGGQYIYFCFPMSFGAPSFKVNGLDFTAVTVSTQTVTNASGFAESFYICRFNTVQFGTLSIQVL